MSMVCANTSQPAPIVGPYGPKWLTHTKNNHYSHVSGVLVRPSDCYISLVLGSDRAMVWWASQFRFKQLLLQISLANQLGIYKTNQLSYYNFYSIWLQSGRTPPRKHGIWWYESAEPHGWYAGDTWHRIVPGCSFQRLYRFDLDPERVSMRRRAASNNVQDS